MRTIRATRITMKCKMNGCFMEIGRAVLSGQSASVPRAVRCAAHPPKKSAKGWVRHVTVNASNGAKDVTYEKH